MFCPSFNVFTFVFNQFDNNKMCLLVSLTTVIVVESIRIALVRRLSWMRMDSVRGSFTRICLMKKSEIQEILVIHRFDIRQFDLRYSSRLGYTSFLYIFWYESIITDIEGSLYLKKSQVLSDNHNSYLKDCSYTSDLTLVTTSNTQL